MRAQFLPEFVVNRVRVGGFSLGEFERGFFCRGEISARAEVGEICDLVFRPSVPLCQSGVRGQSIIAVVDLGSAHDHQFLQLGGNGSGFHDGPKMSNQRAEDFGAMCDCAEHVGHVAAFFEVMVVDLSGLGIDLRFVESFDTHEFVESC